MKKLIVALALMLPTLAGANTYRVDLIVFLDKTAPTEQGRRYTPPQISGALALDNVGALRAAGITLIDDASFGLNDQWQRLRTAKRYQPLMRLAWVQRNPPAGRSTPLRLMSGEGFTIGDNLASSLVLPMEGTVNLSGGQLLHLDVDLIYAQPTESGAVSWRLDERRKMKLNELHHFDSGRLGVLARIVKINAQ